MEVSITGQLNSQLPPPGGHSVVELGPEPLNTTVTVSLDQHESARDGESLEFAEDIGHKQAVEELAHTGRRLEAPLGSALAELFQVQLIQFLGVHHVASE